MKIREIIQEFVPCEVCGNRDMRKFYFHVIVHQGSQPFVKCGECKEEYYSTKAREIITRIEDARKLKKQSSLVRTSPIFDSYKKKDYRHPLVTVLSHI